MKAFDKLFNEIMGQKTSGKDVARILAKSPSYVSQIRGGEQIPKDEVIAAFCDAFAPERLPELLLAATLTRLSDQKGEDNGRRKRIQQAWESIASAVATKDRDAQGPKRAGRTLKDFPDAFYPLAVVTGDKREDRGAHISIADLGAYSATPADTRWIMELGLRDDVVKHIDKNFLLLAEDRLIERFAETNLLVVAGPSGNHLGRIVNRSSVFRFNYGSDVDKGIDEAINKARGLTRAQLAGYQEESRLALTGRMRSLFTGGLFDPTYTGEYVAAKYAQVAFQTEFDFGVLTFAANPFYELKCRREGRPNDHRYVAIMAAGIHHPATAHAVRLLGRPMRQKGVFEKHPYGGVLRVTLDLDVPFAERTEQAECVWEDQADKTRSASQDQKKDLLEELESIHAKLKRGELKHVELSAGQAAACRELIEKL